MPKDETDLRHGAAVLWPGSSEYLVTVYQCLKHAKRGGWLLAGATINSLLNGPKSERAGCLRHLRSQVEDAISTRNGPKRERYDAAIKALDRLDRLDARAKSC
jgi:hypothetical protein